MKHDALLVCRSLLLSAALLGMSCGPAFAKGGIVLLDSVGFGTTTGSTEDADGTNNTRTVGSSELGSFDANGAAKLVVTLAGEGNSVGDNTVTGVTYGGVPMTKIKDRSGGRQNSMWYLDDVSVSGDFVITYNVSDNNLGFAAYALSGTVSGFVETVSSSANTAPPATTYNAQMTMTTTLPGELVIASFERNNYDDGGGVGVKAPLIKIYYAGMGGCSAASAYQLVAEPGAVTPTILQITNGAGTIIATRFEPIVYPPGMVLILK